MKSTSTFLTLLSAFFIIFGPISCGGPPFEGCAKDDPSPQCQALYAGRSGSIDGEGGQGGSSGNSGDSGGSTSGGNSSGGDFSGGNPNGGTPQGQAGEGTTVGGQPNGGSPPAGGTGGDNSTGGGGSAGTPVLNCGVGYDPKRATNTGIRWDFFTSQPFSYAWEVLHYDQNSTSPHVEYHRDSSATQIKLDTPISVRYPFVAAYAFTEEITIESYNNVGTRMPFSHQGGLNYDFLDARIGSTYARDSEQYLIQVIFYARCYYNIHPVPPNCPSDAGNAFFNDSEAESHLSTFVTNKPFGNDINVGLVFRKEPCRSQ